VNAASQIKVTIDHKLWAQRHLNTTSFYYSSCVNNSLIWHISIFFYAHVFAVGTSNKYWFVEHKFTVHPASFKMGMRSLYRGKAAGAWRWPPSPSSAEVKEGIDLHLYTTSEPSWPGYQLRRNRRRFSIRWCSYEGQLVCCGRNMTQTEWIN
jgi:hypothetical protein